MQRNGEINKNQIGIMGISAGGHLHLQLLHILLLKQMPQIMTLLQPVLILQFFFILL
jgi:acetyl esterase/lipase